MKTIFQKSDPFQTRLAFLLTSLFNAPFWALYGMIEFILYKDLAATTLQIALLITLKPVVSLFSVYWSSIIFKRPDRLRSNLIAAGLFAHLPFFFVPIIDNPWYFLVAAAIYMMFMRGVMPAWMEILKRNLPHEAQAKVYSSASSISYLCGIILPLCFGSWMDTEIQIWRYLFPAASLLSLGGILFQWRMPITNPGELIPEEKESLINILVKPWRNGWKLFRSRPDFLHFQWGFMLGGGGLMMMKPALPLFFVDFLHLSYVEIALAIALCKGIGFALTSRLWASVLRQTNLFRFSAFVTLLAALFPFSLLLAKTGLIWLYLGYLIYGIMQAGSELGWHLSGPIFSKEEESSAYSSVSVAAVGLRGCIAPCLGSITASFFGAGAVLLIGGGLCLLASLTLYRSKYQPQLAKR